MGVGLAVYLRVRSVVTHPRVCQPASRLEDVLRDLESLLRAPSLTLLGEGPARVGHMRTMLLRGKAIGNLAHDAHIAALAMEHGVRELWTADRDFTRFPGLSVRDPFVG